MFVITTIDCNFYAFFYNLNCDYKNKPLRYKMKSFIENFTLVSTATIVGLIVSVVAQIFALTAKYIYDQSIGDDTFPFFRIVVYETEINTLPFFSCLLASFVVCTLIKVCKIERWHGPADTIYAAHQKDGTLDIKMGFNSTLASFFSISGGASVGIYGPLVHFGGTLAAYLRRRSFIPNIPHDVIIGAGVAAAISAGFGSPIAGIIFAHEVVIRHFSMKALAGISIASIIANFSAKKINLVEPVLLFDKIAFDMFSAFPSLFLVGLFSAILAFIFMKSLLLTTKIANNSNIKFYVRPLIPGVICGSTALFFPEVIGLGSETIVNVITENNGIVFLLLLLILKIFLTSLCIGFGLFGGILSPALLIGVCAGSIIFNIPLVNFDNNINAVLAVSGMAAVCSSVIGGPITAILLILELTNSYEYALASIMPIAISNLITYLIFGSSFFDAQLKLRNIKIDFGREHILLDQTKIVDYASKNFLNLNKADDVKTAENKFQKFDTTEAYYLDENFCLIGKLKLINILNKKGKAINFIEEKPLSLKSDMSVLEAIKVLKKFVGENIPILDNKRRVIGIISENDILKAYGEITTSIRNIEKN